MMGKHENWQKNKKIPKLGPIICWPQPEDNSNGIPLFILSSISGSWFEMWPTKWQFYRYLFIVYLFIYLFIKATYPHTIGLLHIRFYIYTASIQ